MTAARGLSAVAATILVVATALALSRTVGRPVVVAGHSMAPALEAGDLVLVKPVPGSAIRPGDVILRSDGRAPVIHRVVSVSEEDGVRYLITRGDANGEPDPTPMVVGGSVGRVEHLVPGAGRLLVGLRPLPTRVATVLLLFTMSLQLSCAVQLRQRGAHP